MADDPCGPICIQYYCARESVAKLSFLIT